MKEVNGILVPNHVAGSALNGGIGGTDDGVDNGIVKDLMQEEVVVKAGKVIIKEGGSEEADIHITNFSFGMRVTNEAQGALLAIDWAIDQLMKNRAMHIARCVKENISLGEFDYVKQGFYSEPSGTDEGNRS